MENEFNTNYDRFSRLISLWYYYIRTWKCQTMHCNYVHAIFDMDCLGCLQSK